MDKLSGIRYTGDKFKPMIEARDARTLPEFHKLTGSTLTQTAAIAAVRRVIDENANIVRECGQQMKETPITQSMDIPVWAMKFQEP